MDSKFWGKIVISAVVLGLATTAWSVINTTADVTQLLLPPVQVSSEAEAMQKTVVLARSEVAVQEKGHLARALFSLDNRGDQDVKNFKILCTLLDNSGVEQGRDIWLVPETVKAHGNGVFSYTSKKFIGNRAVASQCQIVDLELVTAPLIAIHRESGHGAGSQDAHGAGAEHGGGSH